MIGSFHQTRSRLLEIAREADKRTNDRVGMTALQGELKGLADCVSHPVLKGAVGLQGVMIDSYLSGPMKNPKVVDSTDESELAYAREAALATEIHLFGCTAGMRVLDAKQDDQRCAVNLGADACLVGLDGGLGAGSSVHVKKYVNAVRTSESDKLVTIQAQGPRTPEQVAKLIAAATRHAERTGCKQVIFVNASTDKVPAYGDAVNAIEPGKIALSYRELHWIDGEVPQTPQGRAVIVDFVRTLSTDIKKAQGKTLVVFNCHIGLDRSGVTNALTQLMIDHNNVSSPLSAATDVLRNIKRARPHGISTVFRFHLILRCFQDLQSAPSAA